MHLFHLYANILSFFNAFFLQTYPYLIFNITSDRICQIKENIFLFSSSINCNALQTVQIQSNIERHRLVFRDCVLLYLTVLRV